MNFKTLTALLFSVLLIQSCSEETTESSSNSEEKHSEEKEKVTNTIIIERKTSSEVEEIDRIEGDAVIDYLQDPKTITEVHIVFANDKTLDNETVYDCLKSVNFEHIDSVSYIDYKKCISEKTTEKFLIGAHKNIKTKKGKTVNYISFSLK